MLLSLPQVAYNALRTIAISEYKILKELDKVSFSHKLAFSSIYYNLTI